MKIKEKAGEKLPALNIFYSSSNSSKLSFIYCSRTKLLYILIFSEKLFFDVKQKILTKNILP